ncbi:hypothetical protein FRC02_004051 [Tulasnella sp. 418]|nr:hypothetical protein FRC02_004051 [Tulasnella sp. 418]
MIPTRILDALNSGAPAGSRSYIDIGVEASGTANNSGQTRRSDEIFPRSTSGPFGGPLFNLQPTGNIFRPFAQQPAHQQAGEFNPVSRVLDIRSQLPHNPISSPSHFAVPSSQQGPTPWAEAFSSAFNVLQNVSSQDPRVRRTGLASLSNLLRQAVNSVPESGGLFQGINTLLAELNSPSPRRSSALYHAAVDAMVRFEQGGNPADLEEALSHGWNGLIQIPEANRFGKAIHHNLLGQCLKLRFVRAGNVLDLEAAISHARSGLMLQPPGHKWRAVWLDSLSEFLHYRYERFKDLRDLDEAILLSRESVSLEPSGMPNRAESSRYLAQALVGKFKRFENMIDLDEAISQYQACLLEESSDHDRITSLTGLGNALLLRFPQTSDPSDLEIMIMAYREALSLHHPSHSFRCILLTNLAGALMYQFTLQGSADVLNEIIELFQGALTLRPPGHPKRHAALINVAASLIKRFERWGDPSDLHAAIDLFTEAVTIGENLPELPICLLDLASALHIRFSREGDPADLRQSIVYSSKALALRPPEPSQQRTLLGSLSVSLGSRYTAQGSIGDLEEVIRYRRDALLHLSPTHFDRPIHLDQLGDGLIHRFRIYREFRDLQEAITCHQEALLLEPPGDARRPCTLSHMAHSLLVHYRHSENPDVEDLESCTQYFNDALTLTPPQSPLRSLKLVSLAACLRLRWETLKHSDSLDQALDHLREALSLQSPSYPGRCVTLSQLGDCLLSRYKSSGNVVELEEAVRCHGEALEGIPLVHPRRAEGMRSLANAFIACGTLPGGKFKLGLARNLLRNASNHPTASAYTRLAFPSNGYPLWKEISA